jgi:hypothetical protein
MVHFHTRMGWEQSNGGGEGPYAAVVTRVLNPDDSDAIAVNLTVFRDGGGQPFGLNAVPPAENVGGDVHWWVIPPPF